MVNVKIVSGVFLLVLGLGPVPSGGATLEAVTVAGEIPIDPSDDSNDTQFTEGKTPIAFAVWNGSNKERNSQKGVTHFHELTY